MSRYPVLDQLRIGFLSDCIFYNLCAMDHNFNILKVYPDSVRPYIEGEQPAIFALDHGRLSGVLKIVNPRSKFKILISHSRDGEIIARAINKMGFSIVRGSSKKGAVQATKQILTLAREGCSVVVTVDGPRGPIHEVKSGIVRLAEMTGLPIVPLACSARHFTQMWGWDKFMLAHLGTPEVYLYGEPIFIGRARSEEEREQNRQRLSDAMEALRFYSDDLWPSIGVKQEIHC